jgi:hypothetical protein
MFRIVFPRSVYKKGRGFARLGLTLGLFFVLDAQAVLINEFMASNTKTIESSSKEFSDWIELYNPDDTAVDVGGWYLTDDVSAPRQWRFPLDRPDETTIPARGYLLVWADNDPQAEGLHAEFALRSGGEQIGLYAQDGATLMDMVLFGAQTSDVSYGRFPDGAEDWRLLSTASPGAANEAVYAGAVAPVTFSAERGFYAEAITLTLASPTPDVEILYTLDGSNPLGESEPDPDSSGRGGRGEPQRPGMSYEEPLVIQRTTCVRAVAIKEQWHPSPVVTHTYLFLEDIKRQSLSGQKPGIDWPGATVNGQTINYGMDPDIVNDPAYADRMDDALTAIPTISIVTHLDHLFDARTGIYVNANAEGRNWERPASVELIHPDGTEGFQIHAGLRIRGGFSRSGSNPKHAFRLLFRAEYGAPLLQYPLFEAEGTDAFNAVDLRTSQNYSWSFQGDRRNTMVREVFSRDVQGEMGHPTTRSRYYHLYLNGQYWGLYQTQERAEASFAASYMGGNEEDYDVVKVDRAHGRTMWATDGNMDAYRQLYDLATQGFADPDVYLQAQGLDPNGQPHPDYPKLLDVDNLIDFMLIEYLTGDRDGPGSRYGNIPNNTFCIYNRVNPDGFKWFQHDSEHSLGTGEYNLVQPFTAAGSQWPYFNPHWLHERLARTSEDYRQRFMDRAHRHCQNDGLLSPQANIDRILARAAQIEVAMIAESARWGDSRVSQPFTQADWQNEVDWIVASYLPSRTDVLLDQFKQVNWYPLVEAPEFTIDNEPRHGGYITRGAMLAMEAPAQNSTVYYSTGGVDPRLGERPDATLETLVDFNAPKRVWVPTGPVDPAWQGGQTFDDAAWMAGQGHVGFDLAWSADFDFGVDLESAMWARSASCYVRIPFQLTEDRLSYQSLRLHVWFDDGFVAYLNGVRIAETHAPEQPTWQDHALQAHEAGSAPVTFDVTAFQASLRAGENILALQGLNSSSTSPDFLISAALEGADTQVTPVQQYVSPFPVTRSLRVGARSLQNGQWSALSEAVFVVDDVTGLRLTEIMYHPAEGPQGGGAASEYIELFNAGQSSINLNLVQLTGAVEYVFSDTVLEPGSYALVVRDRDSFVGFYGAGLPIVGQYDGQLSNRGEPLVLQDPLGHVLVQLRYSDGSHPEDFAQGQDAWPSGPDGTGLALGIVDTEAQAGDPANWRAITPSPGQP